MSHDHNHNHIDEKKPVAFTVPLILASVFIFIMVLVLSLCNPKHHSAAEHSKTENHNQHTGEDAKKEPKAEVNSGNEAHESAGNTAVVADSTAK